MSKHKFIKVTIDGESPLLMNRFTEKAQESAGKGTSIVAVGDQGSPREQAEPKLYTNKQGQIVFPGPNFFSCLIEAGKFHKLGKSKITTARSSLIPAGLLVMEVDSLIKTKADPPWEVDSRPIVNPSTKGRRICHRPRMDSWGVTFTLDVDVSMFDPKFVRQLVDDAGVRVGLGDFRPDRKGPFGRFKVTKWEVTE